MTGAVAVKTSDTFLEADKTGRSVHLATRIPAFMYLNDEREKTALEVIETTDDALFKKVTGITKADFRKLLDLGVFQAEFMNEAIRTFKNVEDNALEYLGDREITGGWVAAWDAHVER